MESQIPYVEASHKLRENSFKIIAFHIVDRFILSPCRANQSSLLECPHCIVSHCSFKRCIRSGCLINGHDELDSKSLFIQFSQYTEDKKAELKEMAMWLMKFSHSWNTEGKKSTGASQDRIISHTYLRPTALQLHSDIL